MKKSNIVKVVSIIVFSIIISVLVLSLNNKNNYLNMIETQEGIHYTREGYNFINNDIENSFLNLFIISSIF